MCRRHAGTHRPHIRRHDRRRSTPAQSDWISFRSDSAANVPGGGFATNAISSQNAVSAAPKSVGMRPRFSRNATLCFLTPNSLPGDTCDRPRCASGCCAGNGVSEREAQYVENDDAHSDLRKPEAERVPFLCNRGCDEHHQDQRADDPHRLLDPLRESGASSAHHHSENDGHANDGDHFSHLADQRRHRFGAGSEVAERPTADQRSVRCLGKTP